MLEVAFFVTLPGEGEPTKLGGFDNIEAMADGEYPLMSQKAGRPVVEGIVSIKRVEAPVAIEDIVTEGA